MGFALAQQQTHNILKCEEVESKGQHLKVVFNNFCFEISKDFHLLLHAW